MHTVVLMQLIHACIIYMYHDLITCIHNSTFAVFALTVTTATCIWHGLNAWGYIVILKHGWAIVQYMCVGSNIRMCRSDCISVASGHRARIVTVSARSLATQLFIATATISIGIQKSLWWACDVSGRRAAFKCRVGLREAMSGFQAGFREVGLKHV